MNIHTSYSYERQISATAVGNVIRVGELNQKMEWTWLRVAKQSSKGKRIKNGTRSGMQTIDASANGSRESRRAQRDGYREQPDTAVNAPCNEGGNHSEKASSH